MPAHGSLKPCKGPLVKNNEVLKQFYDQFIGILKFHKAEPIDVKPNDPFDYSNHEALSSIERDDLPNNSIIEIIQDGWKMDKDILRFSKVIVSREPLPPEPEPEPEIADGNSQEEEERTDDTEELEEESEENGKKSQ